MFKVESFVHSLGVGGCRIMAHVRTNAPIEQSFRYPRFSLNNARIAHNRESSSNDSFVRGFVL